jgi:hypothetical protein
VKVIFSSFFKQVLLEEESRYSAISTRLGDDFHDRVKDAVRVVIKWKGSESKMKQSTRSRIIARVAPAVCVAHRRWA